MATRNSSPIRTRDTTKGDRTRELLVATMIDLVNTRPIESMRVADICEPAGLAVSAFYFHFKSKDEAIDEIATAVVADVYDGALAMPSSPDLFSEIAGILSEFYRAALEQRARVKAFFHIMNARAHPRVRAAWLARREALVARLVSRIDIAREAGAAPAFRSSLVTAHFLIGGLERFYDDVFFLTIDDVLPASAANFDTFVRQQALAWTRVIEGRAPHD